MMRKGQGMSGLIALLDDVAGIAKVAAASVDDVVAQAAKAGAKAAGAVIDDAAVTPKYMHGFAASRELPVIWKIAKGSLRNKLLYLLPVGLALSAFAPWAITPLLMLGGGYLCFEGAEKVYHALFPHDQTHVFEEDEPGDPAHLEERKAAGAIKTDFILSAEIMTIALAAIPPSNFWMEAATLATVAVMITAAVYGAVALIVKADDVGLHLAAEARFAATRAFGRGVVRAMPHVLTTLTLVGTAAMLWVGGNIIVHGLDVLGWGAPYDLIHHVAHGIGQGVSETFSGAVTWIATATMDGIIGLGLGLVLIPIVTRGVVPVWTALRGKS